MLGTSSLPGNLVKALSERFRDMREEVVSLLTEKRSGRGVHSFLAHIASGVDMVPGFEGVAILQVDLDGTVHLMHLLFSVPVGMYYTD